MAVDYSLRPGPCGISELAMAKFCFIMLGVGYLFPFSTLMGAVDYYKMKMPNNPDIEARISSTYMCCSIVILSILTLASGKTGSYKSRIVTGFVGQFSCIFVLPIFCWMELSELQMKTAVLTVTALVAGLTALLDNSMLSLAALFDDEIQQNLQIGIGVSTLIGLVYRDITKLAFDWLIPGLAWQTQVKWGTIVYFYVGASTLLVCISCFLYLLNMDLTQEAMCRAVCGDIELADPSGRKVQRSPGGSVLSQRSPGGSDVGEYMPLIAPVDPSQVQGVSKLVILKKTWHLLICVVFTFLVSLSMWPGVVTEMRSTSFPHLNDTEWSPLIMLTLFAVMDMVGRFMSGYTFGFTADNIWIFAVVRTALIPLIILATKNIWFESDAWDILFVALLGHGNGYIGTVCIIMCNGLVEPAEKAVSGMLTAFALNAGLVCGSLLGLYFHTFV